MEANVKLWQLIIACVGTLIGVGTIVYNAGGRDKDDAIKIESLQYQVAEIRENRKIDRKEDNEWKERVMNMLLDIKLTLKDKEDRKR